MSVMPLKVFLSYARGDKNRVQGIALRLREAGFDVWDPEQDILPGADWLSESKEALATAGALVAFISPESVASRQVSYEIEYALGARHLSRRLIPVLIEPAKNAPWILDKLHPVTYEGSEKTSQKIVNLLSQSVDSVEMKFGAY